MEFATPMPKGKIYNLLKALDYFILKNWREQKRDNFRPLGTQFCQYGGAYLLGVCHLINRQIIERSDDLNAFECEVDIDLVD